MIVVPNIGSPMVDKEGRPTSDYHAFLVQLAKALNEQSATLANHEERIEALEP